MTGAEHYAAAERLLAWLDRTKPEDDHPRIDGHQPHLIAAAQVHATLALAAATVALGGATASPPPPRHVTLRPDPGDDELCRSNIELCGLSWGHAAW